MMKGLPGCGKSTKAKEMMESDAMIVRVNKDDLRSMLHNGHWSKFNEKQVLRMRDSIIIDTLNSGRHIIVDDTNLAPKHEERLKQLAKENNAVLKIVDMTDVSVKECVKRDLMRAKSVGKDVILSMYNKFLKPIPQKIQYNSDLPECVIVDIDGTVAVMSDRSPYDWDRVDEDFLNVPVAKIVTNLQKKYRIVFLSGRDSICREASEIWLKDNFDFTDFELYMRAENDNRKDSIIKKELYENNVKARYNVVSVIDDRKQVVDMWRSLGLTCLQVDEGDF